MYGRQTPIYPILLTRLKHFNTLLSVYNWYCRPCLLKTAREPSITLWTIETGAIRESNAYRLESRTHLLAPRVLMTSLLKGRKHHGAHQKARSGTGRHIRSYGPRFKLVPEWLRDGWIYRFKSIQGNDSMQKTSGFLIGWIYYIGPMGGWFSYRSESDPRTWKYYVWWKILTLGCWG